MKNVVCYKSLVSLNRTRNSVLNRIFIGSVSSGPPPYDTLSNAEQPPDYAELNQIRKTEKAEQSPKQWRNRTKVAEQLERYWGTNQMYLGRNGPIWSVEERNKMKSEQTEVQRKGWTKIIRFRKWTIGMISVGPAEFGRSITEFFYSAGLKLRNSDNLGWQLAFQHFFYTKIVCFPFLCMNV